MATKKLRKEIKLICPVCEKEFTKLCNSSRKYCSDKCGKKIRDKRKREQKKANKENGSVKLTKFEMFDFGLTPLKGLDWRDPLHNPLGIGI